MRDPVGAGRRTNQIRARRAMGGESGLRSTRRRHVPAVPRPKRIERPGVLPAGAGRDLPIPHPAPDGYPDGAERAGRQLPDQQLHGEHRAPGLQVDGPALRPVARLARAVVRRDRRQRHLVPDRRVLRERRDPVRPRLESLAVAQGYPAHGRQGHAEAVRGESRLGDRHGRPGVAHLRRECHGGPGSRAAVWVLYGAVPQAAGQLDEEASRRDPGRPVAGDEGVARGE